MSEITVPVRERFVTGLVVLAPISGMTVSSKFWVDGTYTTEGKTISVECKDKNGATKASGTSASPHVTDGGWSVFLEAATPGPNPHQLYVSVVDVAEGPDNTTFVNIDGGLVEVGEDKTSKAIEEAGPSQP